MSATAAAFYASHRAGLFLLHLCMLRASANWCALSDDARPLSAADVVTLSANSLLEHSFLLLLVEKLSGAFLVDALTPVRFYLLFWIDDLFYCCLHRLLHAPVLFRLVHAHHHRSRKPARGYLDAGNEHPLEQLAALSLHLAAVDVVARVLSLDAASVVLHVSAKAAGSILNHLAVDATFSLGCGVVLSSTYHREHHMTGCKHYAQFIPAVDRAVTILLSSSFSRCSSRTTASS